MEEEKQCTKCNLAKPLSGFYKDSRKTGGYCYSCKECDKSRRRELYPGKNADYKKLYIKERRKTIAFKQRMKALRQKNKELLKNELLCRQVLNNLLKPRKTKRRSAGKYKLILGYGHEELKEHLQSLFITGMDWSNRGVGEGNWQIDHIKPVSLFDKGTSIRIINSLSNLRPLWAIENAKRKNNG